ncbi:MAG: hypothetical protein KBC73_25395 [Burkholderiaceae bacterium]|nr:hypothetical protein [Burkholderiaceae bacterium]
MHDPRPVPAAAVAALLLVAATTAQAHADGAAGGQNKAGRDRKLKLPTVTSAFVTDLAKDMPPTAPFLTRSDGRAWTTESWNEPLKVAAAAAGLPANTVIHSLRHSVVTDLVVRGFDLTGSFRATNSRTPKSAQGRSRPATDPASSHRSLDP